MLKEHFKKTIGGLTKDQTTNKKTEIPDGLFCKCSACGTVILEEDFQKENRCCPECGKHFRLDVWSRINITADQGTFQEWDKDLEAGNPLDFPDYEKKIQELQAKTGLKDAVVTGQAKIYGNNVALGVMSPDFMMGSMGTVVGEKITRMVERATKEGLPIVLFCCSGGARMQEGIYSLMQMAKVSQALKRHDEAGLLYVPVLTDPTTGGVTASFAMLGDVIVAEQGATIGFAGERVIRQTIGQKLPEGFQSAEFLLKHGFVDYVVKRKRIRKVLRVLIESSSKKTGEKHE
jgi:acetyl-CoA carboxylase carboxyl transferase beta subunit